MGMITDRTLMESITRCEKDVEKGRIISPEVCEKKYITNLPSV
jgi:hypothetical protein